MDVKWPSIHRKKDANDNETYFSDCLFPKTERFCEDENIDDDNELNSDFSQKKEPCESSLKDMCIQSKGYNESFEILYRLICEDIKRELDLQFSQMREQLELKFQDLYEHTESDLEKDLQLQKKDELFHQVYADLKKQQNGLDKVILSPLLKNAIKWYERVQEIVHYYQYKIKSPGARSKKMNYKISNNLLREINNFGEYIIDTLENFDVEVICPQEGEKFDRSLHEAVSKVGTKNITLSETIKKCCAVGFRYTDGKIIQYAKVVVYKLED